MLILSILAINVAIVNIASGKFSVVGEIFIFLAEKRGSMGLFLSVCALVQDYRARVLSIHAIFRDFGVLLSGSEPDVLLNSFSARQPTRIPPIKLVGFFISTPLSERF
jgi:hypothetical protein